MPRILAADARFPALYHAQADVAREFLRVVGGRGEATPERVGRFFHSVGVAGRHMVLPIEAYPRLNGFGERSTIWLEHALELGSAAVDGALARAGLSTRDVALFGFSTVTGVAVPSLESRIISRLGGFRADCRRLPLFGLGCVAGAAGIARVCDFLRAYPREAAIMLCVELCSLTFQLADMSVANVIASALFGDGAACVVLVGDEHPLATGRAPSIIDTRSVLFEGTERTMGWDIVDTGFRIVLSGSVPDLARGPFSSAARAFLASHEFEPGGVEHWIGHPGGPAVIDAIEQGLCLPRGTLDASRRGLAERGNLSSASVLVLLRDVLDGERPAAGAPGMLFAMGPGFCAELVLLRW
ncbi:MAG: type III polyketide synthase [Acidobacteriota bacterium]